MKEELIKKAERAKSACRKLANLSTEIKNKALLAIADALKKEKTKILSANQVDLNNAKKVNLSSALIDRLTLNEKRISEMVKGLKEIVDLSDPVGKIIAEWTRPFGGLKVNKTEPNGLKIQKVSVPLGVILMIYESRPNVTIEASGLCLKSGNAVILRGGSEAIKTNTILAKIIGQTAYANGIPDGSIEFIETTEREAISELIKLDQYIDLVIPRGGEEMIRAIREKATVPVLAHGKGNCHTYVDKEANIEMAIKICYNAKVQRPGVCNAMEKLLVHQEIAKKFLPLMIEEYKKAGVELRGCTRTQQIIPEVKPATEDDWYREYLTLILAIKIVDSVEEAIEHINKYGSGHSETIVTENKETAKKFLQEVDSSAVFHNASTRLHDGGVFGFGSEIGISTQKLHARGTMGLNELTSTKYIVFGKGQIRE
jgi:glutamate-5-semialdehyde dehydrogenase